MHTEFESVSRCFHIGKLSLHVFVYISIYIHADTTCVYIFTHMYTKSTNLCTPSTCVCAYIYILVRQIHMSVMMMIAFITFKSSLVPLFEGL